MTQRKPPEMVSEKAIWDEVAEIQRADAEDSQ